MSDPKAPVVATSVALVADVTDDAAIRRNARRIRSRRGRSGAIVLGVSVAALVVAFGAASAGAVPGSECWWRSVGDGRDLCLRYQLLMADRQEVPALASAIMDPVARAAGVTTWLQAHRQGIALGDTIALCGLLGRDNEASCVKQMFGQQMYAAGAVNNGGG